MILLVVFFKSLNLNDHTRFFVNDVLYFNNCCLATISKHFESYRVGLLLFYQHIYKLIEV